MNAYEFIVRMKDYASSGLQKVARSVGVVKRETGLMNNTMRTAKRLLATAFLAVGIGSFISDTIQARAEYEKFQAVLTNTFQSADVGNSALSLLQDFAAKTPFQLNELTGSFVKLVNRGFAPAERELRQLGDLAASQGKSFDQLTEAVLDAETKEFERLKEFGIKARKEGDKISLTFKNQTKVIDDNSESIRNAILQYGEMEGVSGSMSAISKTLGGQLSNLRDNWNRFLVAVGGESGNIFATAIGVLNMGIGFLIDHLPEISMWFRTLWGYIEPVGVALWNFVKAAFGFNDATSAVSTFGDTMSTILFIVGLVADGLVTVINWLTPFADVIIIAVGAWWALNIAMYANPVSLIIIGIVALLGLIGLITKYTSGWGDSWQAVVNGSKLSFQAFVSIAKANFNTMIQTFMLGIDRVRLGWYEFREAVGLGDNSANQDAINSIKDQIEQRKQSIVDGYKKAAELAKQSVGEFSKVSIDFDKEGFQKDFKKLKDGFKGLGENNTNSNAYNDYLAKTRKGLPQANGETDTKDSKAGQSIISGGTRRTNINITIQKLQDDTKIFVSSQEQGLSDLGEKVQEILLRAVNSVNQMQTT